MSYICNWFSAVKFNYLSSSLLRIKRILHTYNLICDFDVVFKSPFFRYLCLCARESVSDCFLFCFGNSVAYMQFASSQFMYKPFFFFEHVQSSFCLVLSEFLIVLYAFHFNSVVDKIESQNTSNREKFV